MTDLLKCTFVFILCVSCLNDSSLGEDVYQLKSNPILIDWNRMECIEDEFDTVSFHRDSAKLKLIVYVDSTRCSSCYVNTMYQWSDVFAKLQPYKGRAQILFIFSPSEYRRESFHLAVKGAHLGFPVYVDSMDVLLHDNPHIPSNKECHTFLLDERDSVILVGSPLKNKKMEALFWRTVEERLGKPKNEKSE